MATPKLRDWAKELGVNVGYKNGQVTVGDLSFGQGQGQQYGLTFDPTGTHYVSDAGALKQALGLSQPAAQAPTPMQPTPMQPAPMPQFDFAQSINDLYERERQARLSALQNQLRGQTDALNQQRIAMAPQFQQERVQTDTSAQVAGKRLAEMMASRGLDRSGENITANVGLQTARQQALSNIGQRESTAHQQIDQRIADMNVAAQGDMAQAEAALSSERARAMLDSQYRERDFGYQQSQDQLADYWKRMGFDYQKERDQVGDNRYDQEWNWQTDASNPAYQRQMIELEIARINVAGLPEQQKLELDRLKQQLRAGEIDIATANQQLKNLKSGVGTGSGSGSGDSVKPPSAQDWETSIYSDLDNFMDKGDSNGAREWLMQRRDQIRSVLGQKKLDELFEYTDRYSGR